jgi:tripartite-type tricarboxylate transporter receptor subunit TctC
VALPITRAIYYSRSTGALISGVFMKRTALIRLYCCVAFSALCLSAPVHADDYYKNKRIFVVSSSAPGGGYDQFARLFARNIGAHIPGAPVVVVQNMPGAEGVKAANYIYNVAPKDGTFIGALARTLALSKIYQVNAGALQYDALKFRWIGSLKRDIGILVVNTKSGVQNAADLLTHPITVSSQAVNSPNSIYARMLNKLYGAHLTPVEGYEGSTAGLLAVERGEVDGHITGGTPRPVKNRVQSWMNAHQARVVLQFGLQRDPDFPDAPTALELTTDPIGHQLFQMAFTEQEVGSPLVFGPQVGDLPYAIITTAYHDMINDPAFKEDAERERADIYPLEAQNVIDLYTKAYQTSPEIINQLRELAQHH